MVTVVVVLLRFEIVLTAEAHSDVAAVPSLLVVGRGGQRSLLSLG